MGTCSTGDWANTDPECPPALPGQERGMVTRPRGRCQLAPSKGGRDRRSGVAGATGGKKPSLLVTNGLTATATLTPDPLQAPVGFCGPRVDFPSWWETRRVRMRVSSLRRFNHHGFPGGQGPSVSPVPSTTNIWILLLHKDEGPSFPHTSIFKSCLLALTVSPPYEDIHPPRAETWFC